MRKYIPEDATLIPDQAKRVFKGEIFDVYQWQQKLYDGTSATFEMLKRPDTTIAICVKDGKIVLLEEEQPHFGKRTGLPGGRADVESEDELEAIKREVLEETGMTFVRWRLIEAKQMWSKIDHFIYLFIASDFTNQVEPKLDAGEKIETIEYEYDEFMKLANSSDFDDRMPESVMETTSIEELLALPDLYKH